MNNSPDRLLAELAATQHGVFARSDALASGLSSTQTRRRSLGVWVELYEGVFRIPGAVPTWRGDLLAACLAAEAKPAGVSHGSAGALYELPGGRDDLVEVTCRRWKRCQKSGLVVHESTRFDEIDLTIVDGIPVSTPERVVMELAGLRPFPDYVERVMQAARRKKLITYDSMLQTFNRLARRGLPGVKATRYALAEWDPRSRPTHSDMETMLVQTLRDHGLPEPVTQFSVLDRAGNLIATTDGALPRWKITIEYQSKQEHSDEFQLLRDDRRRNEIVAAGYLPLAARYEDLRIGGYHLVEQILEVARRQKSQPA
jgi:hypothetical protein